MIIASAQSDCDREGKDEDGIRRLECPDGPQRRLMSLTKSQSSDVERDADRDMAICQGYQDVEEVGNGDVTVVDGKFFAGTTLVSSDTEAEDRNWRTTRSTRPPLRRLIISTRTLPVRQNVVLQLINLWSTDNNLKAEY